MTRRTILVAHPGAELYGSDRVLLESVSAFVEAGWRVVATVPERGSLVPALIERGATVVGCPTPVVRKSILRPSGFAGFMRASLRGAVFGWKLLSRFRPDAVYVNTVTIPLWIVLGRVRGVPVLAHVHEGESSAPRVFRTALAAPLLLADRVIANSRFSIGVLHRALRRVGERAVLVHNGVAAPLEVSEPRTDLDGLRVGYVGRLSPRKGVDVAVDAVALLRDRDVDVRLDLVGSVFRGYEWYEESLREQVERLALTDRVVFHGFRDSIWSIVEGDDVIVVPSRADEPFGDTAVEAILAGRPVVASATSGLLEATEGYPTARTVAPGDAPALADALHSLAEDWPRLRPLTGEARQLARRRHGADVYRGRVRDLVAELVESRG